MITAVQGVPVKPTDFVVLHRALQESKGHPVRVTRVGDDGKTQDIDVQPHFLQPYGDEPLNFAGMVPRVQVVAIGRESHGYGYIMPGDVVTAISTDGDVKPNPSMKVFRDRLNAAGQAGKKVELTVLRDKTEWVISGLKTMEISRDQYGLKVVPSADETHAVVADVLGSSAASRANVPPGSTITRIGDAPVLSWFDVQAQLRDYLAAHPIAADKVSIPVAIGFTTEGGEKRQAIMELNADDAKAIAAARYTHSLLLDQPNSIRQTTNPVQAAQWGVMETRDFVLQFYLTLRRMVTGNVSAKNMMGPLGIFQAGATIASRGPDWLIWFLSMISANLAVVNFLPIPIVDGGLFTFLILEKIKGRPLSPRTMAYAQVAGIALLVGILLFVTYHDVSQFRFRMR